jgi:hypothetical protein
MGPMKRAMLVMAIAGLTALPAFAQTFTSSSSFSTSIAGMSQTTANFDSDSTGNIAQGAIVDGIKFNYNIDGGLESLAIVSLFDTTSPLNYLGSNDLGTGALFPGDSITMSFASPVNALGLFIILAPGPFSSGDFTLGSATNSSVLETTLGDGGQVLFLGIVSPTAFSSETLSLNASAGEIWNVDDITTATPTPPPTPEPGTFALFASGLAVCWRRVRKMRAAQAKLLS